MEDSRYTVIVAGGGNARSRSTALVVATRGPSRGLPNGPICASSAENVGSLCSCSPVDYPFVPVGVRCCVVSFSGERSVRHSVEVTAGSLYEAAALNASDSRTGGARRSADHTAVHASESGRSGLRNQAFRFSCCAFGSWRHVGDGQLAIR